MDKIVEKGKFKFKKRKCRRLALFMTKERTPRLSKVVYASK